MNDELNIHKKKLKKLDILIALNMKGMKHEAILFEIHNQTTLRMF